MNPSPENAMPCPWCGNTETLDVYGTHANTSSDEDTELMYYYVACDQCGAEGPGFQFENEKAAWTAWNSWNVRTCNTSKSQDSSNAASQSPTTFVLTLDAIHGPIPNETGLECDQIIRDAPFGKNRIVSDHKQKAAGK